MDAMGQLLGHYRYAAIALVTILTLAIVGAVVLTTTSLGCGPANKLGVKAARCLTAGPVAHVGSPSPTTASPSSLAQPTSQPPPANPGESSNPPYNPGESSNPPYNPGASSNPPYSIPDSSTYPPLPYPATGSTPPGVGLACRLPVFAGAPGSGGFIVFPGQTFVADPRSAVTAPSPSPAAPIPTPPQDGPPGGPPGWYGLTYDAGFSKWLPVPYRWVSPDGVHYAYPLGGDIYAQNVSNGTQLDMGKGRGFTVLDVVNEGVYVVAANQPGLWYLDFSFAGLVTQISATGFWQGVAHGEAYGTPTSSVPQGATNTIEKLDFQFGTVTPFFSKPGGQSTVLGFDLQGNPVIQTWYSNPNGTAIFIAGPQGSFPIAAITYTPYGQNPPFPSGSPIADSHGLWFSVGNGVILYSNGAWYWMAGIGGQLAGQCL